MVCAEMFDHIYLEHILVYKIFLTKQKDSSGILIIKRKRAKFSRRPIFFFFKFDNLKCHKLHTEKMCAIINNINYV